MTGPDCAVMCNLINIHTRTQRKTNGLCFTPGPTVCVGFLCDCMFGDEMGAGLTRQPVGS